MHTQTYRVVAACVGFYMVVGEMLQYYILVCVCVCESVGGWE